MVKLVIRLLPSGSAEHQGSLELLLAQVLERPSTPWWSLNSCSRCCCQAVLQCRDKLFTAEVMPPTCRSHIPTSMLSSHTAALHKDLSGCHRAGMTVESWRLAKSWYLLLDLQETACAGVSNRSSSNEMCLFAMLGCAAWGADASCWLLGHGVRYAR